MAWLARWDTTRPVFCYLHYMDVHGPYNAGPEYLDDLLDAVEQMPNKRQLTQGEVKALTYLLTLPPAFKKDEERHGRLAVYREYWAARYDAGVREMDRHLANLRLDLQKLGLWDDAYVIITADHGEALCEHGFWDHGYSAHHPELHVPLILRWPKVLPAGRRVPQIVRLIDLMPTFEQQLGLPAAAGAQGVSLVPWIAGRPAAEPSYAFAEGVAKGPEQKALYVGDWKLILTVHARQRELYNVAEDPLEQKDVSADHPRAVDELFQTLRRQANLNKQLAANVQVEQTPLTEEQRKRLRSFGYIR